MVSKSDTYSPYKIVHHERKLADLKAGKLPLPVVVQWDITDTCNANCSFCFYRSAGYELAGFNPKNVMSNEVIRRTIKELHELGIKGIQWTGGGEPTLHPDFLEIVKYTEELGLEQALVTNGILMTDKIVDAIKNFSWVRISLDSATAPTYKEVKSVDKFDVVVSNIKKLMESKAPSNVVGISFIICPENYKEILLTARLAKYLKVDNFRISIAMTPERDRLFDKIWEECIVQTRDAQKEESDNFKVFAFSNRIKNLAESFTEFCGYQHFVGVIAPSGVYPCCRLKDDEKFCFGRLENETFMNIWYGDKRKKFIESIENGCYFDCWMTEKNEFIRYLLENSPEHINFV